MFYTFPQNNFCHISCLISSQIIVLFTNFIRFKKSVLEQNRMFYLKKEASFFLFEGFLIQKLVSKISKKCDFNQKVTNIFGYFFTGKRMFYHKFDFGRKKFYWGKIL